MTKRLLVSALFLVVIWAQGSLAQDKPDQDREMCRYSAEHMIEIAEQSLNEQSSRPERVEKRRKLVEEWNARMKSGEDPCSVYADIQKEATTF